MHIANKGASRKGFSCCMPSFFLGVGGGSFNSFYSYNMVWCTHVHVSPCRSMSLILCRGTSELIFSFERCLIWLWIHGS